MKLSITRLDGSSYGYEEIGAEERDERVEEVKKSSLPNDFLLRYSFLFVDLHYHSFFQSETYEITSIYYPI